MQQTIKQLSIGLILFSISSGLSGIAANENSTLHWYHIELILFSQLQTQSLNNEKWPEVSALNLPDNVIQLVGTNPNGLSPLPRNFQMLSKNQWRLSSQQYALNHNDHYQTLLHLAWNEGFKRYAKTRPLYIQTEQLSGVMQITMQHYFEFQSDIIYNVPTDVLTQYTKLSDYKGKNLQNNQATFQIMQSGRMRSHELNYLDHPVLGMLIQIDPIQSSNQVTETS